MKSYIQDKDTLICEELNQLTQILTNYYGAELQDYLGLISFFEKAISGFKEIYLKIKIPKNYNPNNSDFLDLNSFYSFQTSYLNKLKNIPDKIETDVLKTLKNFTDEFELDNKNILFSLSSIIEDISTQQNIVDKRKTEFEEEKKMKKDYKNSLKYELYVKEMEALSKLLSNSEKKFNEIKETFEGNELKKNKMISNCLYIYLNIIHEELDSIDNKSDDIKKLIKKYKENKDKKSIKDIFPNLKIFNIKNWSENFSDWEELKFQGNEAESIIFNKIEKKEEKIKEKNTNNNLLNEFYVPQIVISNNIIGIDDEFMVLKSQDNNLSNFVDISEDEEKIKDNITINNFIYGLDKINQDNNMLINIEDVFGRNIGRKNFYIDFCDRIIKAKGEQKTLYEFKIFSTLVYLTNVLNLILENIKDDLLSDKLTKDYFDSYKILDKIICIGEKSVNEDTYMCALLSKNKIFKDQKIWLRSIKSKIINLLNELCTKEYLSKTEDSVFRPAKFIQKNKGIGKIIGAIGGLIEKGKEKKLIELCGFDKSIEHYSKLSNEQKKQVDNNALSIFHGVIKCYIRHLTNYNFNLENEKDIISIICNTLNIKDEEHIIFYCYYYQDCIYTSKKIYIKNNRFISNENKEKTNYIKSENKNKKLPEKYILDIKNDSNKYFIIKKVCRYLDDEDKLKLICLGKYYEKIKKYIYKSFLKKDISIKRRIHIWKSYFNFKKIITFYNYKEILKETQTEFFLKANEESVIQIKKDQNRTYIRKKNKNSEQQIYNILISFVFSEEKIKYVQGINGITGFLYDLTENEEDTFYLLISLFIMTQIRDIFEDSNFQILKTFFYTIERLVYLYLPKIYSKLKDNNIELSFFMSAYFVSLYTILYPSLPKDDISFIIHLYDDFIFDGWQSFFSVWLSILKYHEIKILNIPNDKLLDFLTNKIKDSELFKKENYQKFSEIKKKFKISEELVKNLQNEIAIEAGIRKVGASTIIEDFNADDKVGK